MRGNEKVLEERWHRGGGEIQLGVFDAFAGSEGVGELTEVAGGTLNEEDLEIPVFEPDPAQQSTSSQHHAHPRTR